MSVLRPSYRIDESITLQRLLVEVRWLDFYGCDLTAGVLDRLIDVVCGCLPAKISPDAVRESLRMYCGATFDRVVADAAAWRIAGNLHRLRAGHAVPIWTGVGESEWVPCQIVDLLSASRRAGGDKQLSQGICAHYRILGGLPAGTASRAYWSNAYCGVLADRLGFHIRARSGQRNKLVFPYSSPKEFYGLRFLGLVDPAKSRVDSVQFAEIDATASIQRYNRSLLKRRQRIDFSCPLGQSESLPCFRCPAGRDKCAAACRRFSLVSGSCDACGKSAMLRRGAGGGGLCGNCSVVVYGKVPAGGLK